MRSVCARGVARGVVNLKTRVGSVRPAHSSISFFAIAPFSFPPLLHTRTYTTTSAQSPKLFDTPVYKHLRSRNCVRFFFASFRRGRRRSSQCSCIFVHPLQCTACERQVGATKIEEEIETPLDSRSSAAAMAVGEHHAPFLFFARARAPKKKRVHSDALASRRRTCCVTFSFNLDCDALQTAVDKVQSQS